MTQIKNQLEKILGPHLNDASAEIEKYRKLEQIEAKCQREIDEYNLEYDNLETKLNDSLRLREQNRQTWDLIDKLRAGNMDKAMQK